MNFYLVDRRICYNFISAEPKKRCNDSLEVIRGY